jgi:predicted outer membrane repeat protein
MVVKNCVFANNSCGLDGGAIASYGTSLTLSNVTIANNTSGRGGGAIDNDRSSLTIINTVMWGNTDVKGYGDIWWESGSGGVSYSFTQANWTGTGNLAGAGSPFVNAATPAGADGVWGTSDDGLALAAGSPGIDAGTPDPASLALGNADIARNLRIAGAAIDMGAYESNSTPLPITILSFTGILESGTAQLQWRTGVESNFNHFEVEKSVDGRVLRAQGEIAAKGNGSNYSYSLVQQEPMAYYRLKVVDNDGRYIYSRVLGLSQRADGGIIVYPNPARDFINIVVPDARDLGIYTVDGKLVKIVVLREGVNAIDISEMSAGMYYGVVKGGTVEFVKK